MKGFTALSFVFAVLGVSGLQLPLQLEPTAASSKLNGGTSACESCTSCAAQDSCATNTPGGLLLLTQFWDFSPAIGPDDSWTIHSLWPDLCSGAYDADCDPSRNSNQIASILQNNNASDVLDTMNRYWLALNGNDAQLWSHEWNKHGTCVSTLEPECYPSSAYTEHQDIVDFFRTTTGLFGQYNVYDALAAAGIKPSTSKTYNLRDLQSAAQDAWGHQVTFRCRYGKLNEAWVYFHTVGRSTSPEAFVQTDPLTRNNNCPATGIRYLPK